MATTKSGSRPHVPVSEPPAEQSFSGTTTGQAQPSQVIVAELASLSQTDSPVSAPTEQPPEMAAAVTGVWNNAKTFDAVWSINENRNSWVRVTGGTWVKLLNSSDNVIMSLSALAANAKLTKGQVNFRTEADNMVHEMYVW